MELFAYTVVDSSGEFEYPETNDFYGRESLTYVYENESFMKDKMYEHYKRLFVDVFGSDGLDDAEQALMSKDEFLENYPKLIFIQYSSSHTQFEVSKFNI